MPTLCWVCACREAMKRRGLDRKAEPTQGVIHMEQEVLQVENTRIQALLQQDFATLERLMAEDCIHVESNGTRRTTAQFLAAFKAGEFAFEAFNIEENSVRIYGDTAVVIGRYSNRICTGGKTLPTKRARHLRVYVKRAGSWQLVAHQATELREAT
jgi:uncharacterized protein (TIGR02246 family)